jgi:hypothetical protein
MTPQEREAAIERLRTAGRKGGIATRRKHGKKHFKAIGSTGGKARWKQE